MTGLLLFFLALVFALFATGVFLYGFWKLLQQYSLPERIKELLRALGLTRDVMNPILEAREQAWERGGVMNPAVVKAGGDTHMFYRAVGSDGVSRIGYARSKNGIQIDERPPFPVFALEVSTGGKEAYEGTGLGASGGTYAFAGVEDPRAVIIDDRMYLTFNAFSGWGSLRAAVTSLSLEDLLKKRWKWSPPKYLSPHGQVHKNWVLFPEKIKGNFSILHSLHSGSRDQVLVDHLSELVDDPGIESAYRPVVDASVWDSQLRGAGPPPIKTKKGWLVLYHANDAREPHRYKLGAMLLDLLNPSKVLARSPVPVLEPDAWYENNGKPGIVYACGATIEGDTLQVYYGGGDQVICTAQASLSDILSKLVAPTRMLQFAPAYAPA
jgi:beta-1,2-mannobiose phosphorylase / 1,2-beta-oligomannan phosphorylase